MARRAPHDRFGLIAASGPVRPVPVATNAFAGIRKRGAPPASMAACIGRVRGGRVRAGPTGGEATGNTAFPRTGSPWPPPGCVSRQCHAPGPGPQETHRRVALPDRRQSGVPERFGKRGARCPSGHGANAGASRASTDVPGRPTAKEAAHRQCCRIRQAVGSRSRVSVSGTSPVSAVPPRLATDTGRLRRDGARGPGSCPHSGVGG